MIDGPVDEDLRKTWITKVGREVFCPRCRQLTPTNPTERREDGVIIPCVNCDYKIIVLPV